jgi:hypothetical protein
MKRERETLIARGLILPAHSPHHHTHRCHQQQQRTRTAVISTRVVVPATGVHQASAQQVVSGAPSTHQDSRPHAPSCSVHTARPQRQQGSGSMSERAQRAAPVPSLAEPGQPLVGSDADFHHLNKQLRACYGCKLIKTMAQVCASAPTAGRVSASGRLLWRSQAAGLEAAQCCTARRQPAAAPHARATRRSSWTRAVRTAAGRMWTTPPSTRTRPQTSAGACAQGGHERRCVCVCVCCARLLAGRPHQRAAAHSDTATPHRPTG